jgi:hypothetical protein
MELITWPPDTTFRTKPTQTATDPVQPEAPDGRLGWFVPIAFPSFLAEFIVISHRSVGEDVGIRSPKTDRRH